MSVDGTQELTQLFIEETWDTAFSFNIKANLSPESGGLPSETALESICFFLTLLPLPQFVIFLWNPNF